MNLKPPTILTNLQRGNVKQENPVSLQQRTIHELAAQGELYSIDKQLVNVRDSDDMTPLMWAAGYGQNLTIDLLLGLDADPNLKSKSGQTALMLAANRGFLHIVKTLIGGGANLDDVNDTGCTALMYAAYRNHSLVVQELLKNNANLGIVNSLGQTAYTIALVRKNRMAQASIEAHLVAVLGQNKAK